MIPAITGGRKASRSIPGAALLSLVLLLPAGEVKASSPLAGYNPAHLPYAAPGPFVEFSAFAADTVLPVKGILDDSWRGRFTPRDHNTADLLWNASSGVVTGGWRVALFNRAEMLVESNRDAIEFIYLTKKKKDLQPGRVYRADIGMHGYLASGVELSHGRRLDPLLQGLSAGVTLRYLSPHYLQDGTMTGEVTPLGPRSYTFNLFLDYAYSQNIVYDRSDEDQGRGYGVAADAGVLYRLGGFHASALVRDAVGTIRWDHAPFTTAEAVTPGDPTVVDGYQEFEPTIRGYEGHKRYRQRIPVKTDLALGYRSRSLSATATTTLLRGRPRTWLEAAWGPEEEPCLSLGYSIEYRALGYRVSGKGFSAGVVMEGLTLRDSRALGFDISYRYRW